MHEPTITVTGNLGRDPRLRTVAGNLPVTDFRIACTPRVKDAAGEWSDGTTQWYGVTCFRQLAEHAALSLKKGDRVVVQGRLARQEWTGEDEVARDSMEIEALSLGVDLARHTVSIDRTSRPSATEGVLAGRVVELSDRVAGSETERAAQPLAA